VRGSVIPSVDSRNIAQRRLGLYISCLAPALKERAARGFVVTQHERLGDASINAANATARHNAGLRAIFTAMQSASDGVALRLGDKGDGTPASKLEAKQRTAHLNDGHIPDIIQLTSPPTLYEFKCFTPFLSTVALGHGSPRCGGAPSTADGWFIAFGNTEEQARARVLGLAARGDPDGPALDRRTGAGRVDARDGDYADALRKGSRVALLVCEPSGAASPAIVRLLYGLAASTTLPGVDDTTIYGTGRASPRSFVTHHLAALSHAVQFADSVTLRAHASHLGRALLDRPPPGAAAGPALAPLQPHPASPAEGTATACPA
jgi:hypothetical protein